MEDPNQPQRNYSLRRVFVIVESKCDLAASAMAYKLIDQCSSIGICETVKKKGTMHKMQKMQKMQKKAKRRDN